MINQRRLNHWGEILERRPDTTERALHPAWRAFIQFCGELKHGEIETLKIQDGVPVLAEVIRKKIKFT